MSSTLSALLRHLLAGMLMGSADIIPGVSGGTMALIVGIYERLVKAISSGVSFGLALLRFDTNDLRTHWAALPWTFLLPLALGIGVAIKMGALIIPDLMAAYPEQMRGLFFGLVGASLFIPALRVEQLTPLRFGLGLAAAFGAFFLTGLPVLDAANPSLPRVFFSASVAICAMILPGISGAFLLEVLGIYTPTLEALNTLNGPYVLTFIFGAVLGLGSFAKLLDWLLSHRHDATMVVLVGLIAGALRALWPYTGPTRTLLFPDSSDPIFSVLGLAVLGFGAVLTLLWWTHDSSSEQVSAS